jgi:hypothetical protein
MYFREPPQASIVLMSRRPGAPYIDTLSDDGTELEYEGHDVRRAGGIDPKAADQPWELPNGSPSENARFAKAAQACADGESPSVAVRVYEKLRPGIWSDKGLFHLLGYRYVSTGGRHVFRFKMRLSPEPDETETTSATADSAHTRAIPSWVKQVVYKRDKGRCVRCGEEDHLHFDHDLPFSRGGTSILPENVRLLCARHNLEKSAKIE